MSERTSRTITKRQLLFGLSATVALAAFGSKAFEALSYIPEFTPTLVSGVKRWGYEVGGIASNKMDQLFADMDYDTGSPRTTGQPYRVLFAMSKVDYDRQVNLYSNTAEQYLLSQKAAVQGMLTAAGLTPSEADLDVAGLVITNGDSGFLPESFDPYLFRVTGPANFDGLVVLPGIGKTSDSTGWTRSGQDKIAIVNEGLAIPYTYRGDLASFQFQNPPAADTLAFRNFHDATNLGDGLFFDGLGETDIIGTIDGTGTLISVYAEELLRSRIRKPFSPNTALQSSEESTDAPALIDIAVVDSSGNPVTVVSTEWYHSVATAGSVTAKTVPSAQIVGVSGLTNIDTSKLYVNNKPNSNKALCVTTDNLGVKRAIILPRKILNMASWRFDNYNPTKTVTKVQITATGLKSNETIPAAGLSYVYLKVTEVNNTATPTPTGSPTPTNSPTNSPTRTETVTPTVTQTTTRTETVTPTVTGTDTPTPTRTETATNTATPTATNTETATATNTSTRTNTPTATGTDTATATDTPTPTRTETATITATATNTKTATLTPSRTTSSTPSSSATTIPTGTNVPPTASRTPVPPTSTGTIVPPTATPTDVPSGAPSTHILFPWNEAFQNQSRRNAAKK